MMLILREFILIYYTYSLLIEISLQKNLFSNFLNEDNELILIENKSVKKTNTYKLQNDSIRI